MQVTCNMLVKCNLHVTCMQHACGSVCNMHASNTCVKHAFTITVTCMHVSLNMHVTIVSRILQNGIPEKKILSVNGEKYYPLQGRDIGPGDTIIFQSKPGRLKRSVVAMEQTTRSRKRKEYPDFILDIDDPNMRQPSVRKNQSGGKLNGKKKIKGE